MSRWKERELVPEEKKKSSEEFKFTGGEILFTIGAGLCIIYFGLMVIWFGNGANEMSEGRYYECREYKPSRLTRILQLDHIREFGCYMGEVEHLPTDSKAIKIIFGEETCE